MPNETQQVGERVVTVLRPAKPKERNHG